MRRSLEITLTEGRNRQIRRMAEAIGLQVTELHRTSFCGIGLRGLSEDNWLELNEKEMENILAALEPLQLTARGQSADDADSIE
jgi:16S rRNA U516 pseudouridylate synthase RsuA-like enzyme